MIDWSPASAASPILDRDTTSKKAGMAWSSIVSGIRLYAERQPPEIAKDLNEWASLLESLEMLRIGRR